MAVLICKLATIYVKNYLYIEFNERGRKQQSNKNLILSTLYT
jgi:hypothetical protein